MKSTILPIKKSSKVLTNIILIYSALGIFLVPLTQDVLNGDIKVVLFYLFFFAFTILLVISVTYVIRLLLPSEIAYLNPPKRYYDTLRSQIEQSNPGNQQTVDDALKGSYILELENAIEINSEVFRRKSSFFYNALAFALLAVIPYIVCIGYQLSRKGDAIQKVELINKK